MAVFLWSHARVPDCQREERKGQHLLLRRVGRESFGDSLYTQRSSLPEMMYLPSSLKLARI